MHLQLGVLGALGGPCAALTQSSAIYNDKVLADSTAEILENVVEVPAIEQELALRHDVNVPVEGDLQTAFRYIQVLLHAFTVRREWSRPHSRRQAVENEVNAAAEIEWRQGAALEARFFLNEHRLLVTRDAKHILSIRSTDELRNAQIQCLGQLAKH